MESLSFQYPLWFVAFCLLLGLIYAVILYYNDKTFQDQPNWLKWLMGFLRFGLVSFLSMLLLSPLIKSFTQKVTKPIIVVAQDNSESMAIALKKDSTQFKADINTMLDGLKEQYELKTYSFGNDVREGLDFGYKDKVSNISEVLNEVNDLYADQNLGAVILATDGIYNEGSNPIYAGAKLNAPIYTIAVGDTTPRKDLVLKKVYHNKIAYLGDRFSLQVDVSAQNCVGSNTTLNIFKIDGGGQSKLQSVPLNVNSNDFFKTQEIILDANSAGVQRYRLTVNKVNGEVSTINNSKDIFIEVLDARQKILILANSPHPDVAALKSIIDNNKNYQLSVEYAEQQKSPVIGYDFVILHQLPNAKYPINNILKTIKDRKIPRWFIVGTQSTLSSVNQQQSILKMSGNGNNTDDVQGTIETRFNLFKMDEKVGNELQKFPPLLAQFGEYSASADARVLLYQRIGKVNTQKPLLAFGEEQGSKVAVLAAEGLWKWKMVDYLKHQNYDIFNEIFGKTITYLSVKEDKRKFRVNLAQNIFKENESINFDAELYNESYELINEPDVSLTITNPDRKDFTYTFNKTANAYTLDAGLFPVGSYTYKATTNSAGKQLTANGQFSVRPIQLEKFDLTANHGILHILGEKYGGQVLYQNKIGDIAGLIQNKPDIKPTVYSTLQTKSVINLKWIFFVLLALLSVEWFLRRFFGGY